MCASDAVRIGCTFVRASGRQKRLPVCHVLGEQQQRQVVYKFYSSLQVLQQAEPKTRTSSRQDQNVQQKSVGDQTTTAASLGLGGCKEVSHRRVCTIYNLVKRERG